jgi:hypothetical protein
VLVVEEDRLDRPFEVIRDVGAGVIPEQLAGGELPLADIRASNQSLAALRDLDTAWNRFGSRVDGARRVSARTAQAQSCGSFQEVICFSSSPHPHARIKKSGTLKEVRGVIDTIRID